MEQEKARRLAAARTETDIARPTYEYAPARAPASCGNKLRRPCALTCKSIWTPRANPAPPLPRSTACAAVGGSRAPSRSGPSLGEVERRKNPERTRGKPLVHPAQAT